MSPTIRIDDEVFAALKAKAEAFVDTPNSVLREVLELEDKGSTMSKTKPEVEEKIKGHSDEDAFQVETYSEETEDASITSYLHPRLCFKSKYIESLRDDEEFQVKTKKDGIFRFSKAEFYRVFSNVVQSASYKEDGIYHYPTVPKKALPFKID